MEIYDKEQDIKNAMDSVNLINETIFKEKTDENLDKVMRNAEHLQIIIDRHLLEGEEALAFLTAIGKAEKYIE